MTSMFHLATALIFAGKAPMRGSLRLEGVRSAIQAALKAAIRSICLGDGPFELKGGELTIGLEIPQSQN